MQIIRVCPTAYVVEIIYNQRKHTENCQKTRNFRHNNLGGLTATRSDTVFPQKRKINKHFDLVNNRLSDSANDLLCALLHNRVTSAREYKNKIYRYYTRKHRNATINDNDTNYFYLILTLFHHLHYHHYSIIRKNEIIHNSNLYSIIIVNFIFEIEISLLLFL